MYPGNLAGTMVERGRLSARSAGSSLPPNPSEKTRIRTSSGAEGGYLGPVRREVSGSGSRRMRSMGGTRALEGTIDEGTATKIGGVNAHWPTIGWRVPAWGPDCETGRKRAHLRPEVRAMHGLASLRAGPHHGSAPSAMSRPSRAVQSGGRQLTLTGFAAALPKVKEELVASGFSGTGSLCKAAQPRSSEKNAASRAGQNPCARWAVTISLLEQKACVTAENRAFEEKQPLPPRARMILCFTSNAHI